MGPGAGAGGSACAANGPAEKHCTTSKQDTDATSSEHRVVKQVWAVLTRGSQLGGQQLGDLDGVQRRPLAQVVPRNEQGQTAPLGYARVAPDTADQ